MAVVPSSHIALLFTIYALEYLWRFFTGGKNKYISLGKAIGRFLLAGVYWYFSFVVTDVLVRTALVRYALVIFVTMDLLFVLQEHIMRRILHNDN